MMVLLPATVWWSVRCHAFLCLNEGTCHRILMVAPTSFHHLTDSQKIPTFVFFSPVPGIFRAWIVNFQTHCLTLSVAFVIVCAVGFCREKLRRKFCSDSPVSYLPRVWTFSRRILCQGSRRNSHPPNVRLVKFCRGGDVRNRKSTFVHKKHNCT